MASSPSRIHPLGPGKTTQQLCEAVALLAPDLNVSIVRQSGAAFYRFAPLLEAARDEFSFLANPKYASQLSSTSAGAVVINEATWASEQSRIHCSDVLVCNNPYVFFAYAAQAFESAFTPTLASSVHPTACIDASASIGQNVTIGAYATVAAGVTVGDGCSIGTHVALGAGASIGAGTAINSHVTVYHGVVLGQRCIIHAGTVIGSDGFGFAPYQKRWVKIPQTGTVVIGDDVEVGSNCSIDRGAMGDTVLGRGTKLDNLIQIAHNVRIGEDCAFAANIAIAGSAVIGNRVQMGGKAGVLGHLTVVDDVVISSCTLVTKSITTPGFYSGVYPIQENAEWEKNAVALKRLNALRLQVRELEKSLKATKIES